MDANDRDEQHDLYASALADLGPDDADYYHRFFSVVIGGQRVKCIMRPDGKAEILPGQGVR